MDYEKLVGLMLSKRDAFESDREENRVNELNVVIGVHRNDNRFDVDAAYGEGTYDRLFPDEE